MRAWARRAVAAVAVAFTTSCATPSRQPPAIVLRAEDGPVRLYTEQIGRYRCERGVLACTDAIGRTSQRDCRCTE